MAKIEVTINGAKYPCRPTMGAMLRFKKETGKTVSEYIRDKRIEHAKYLLNTTHLQIQTIALHCGIMDVQYFSKIFKKQLGKTPKEYREALLKQE